MARGKKKKKSMMSKLLNKKAMFIISFCMILFFGGCYFIYQGSIKNEKNKIYYTGNYNSLNYAAFLIDKIEGTNKVISPFNINCNLALLLNGSDNDSRSQIRNYFKKDEKRINEEMANTLSGMNITRDKNEIDILYEQYIEELKSNGYNTYSLNSISSLNSEGKSSLQLLLKKMSLVYQLIKGEITIDKNAIINYELSLKERELSDYGIKSLLDSVLLEVESYNIENNVINYIEIYSNVVNINSVSQSFLESLNLYGVNITNNYDNTIINNKLKDVTDDYIKRVGDSRLESNNLFLINTLYFDYSWDNPFKKIQISSRVFNNSDGSLKDVQMMYSEESTYLENENAIGFVKDFKDKKYSFIGLLPKDEEEIELSSINIEKLLKSKKDRRVLVGIPKFEFQTEVDLKELNKKMGISDIYTEKANLTRMTDEKVYIEKNIEKIGITIGEHGTKESYASNENIETFSYDDDITQIVLNRPFGFLIINNETNECILIGVVNQL